MRDEFSLIRSISPANVHQPSLHVGIGDDAAIYEGAPEMEEVLCVDTMVEEIHFRRDTLTPFQIGYKSLAINISDLAAMGATPKFYLVSIAVPPQWSDREIKTLYRGMAECAAPYRMDLIGGDTVSTNAKLVVTVTAVGHVPKGTRLLRQRARPGDVVFLTGTVGQSAAGLELLNKKGLHGPFTEEEELLVLAHQQPQPQVEAGHLFARSGYRIALNDVSDGVASEANELAEASKVKLVLKANTIPLHPAMETFSKEQQLEWALFGGEDFQLIGTAAVDAFASLQQLAIQRGISLTEIGYVEAGSPVVELEEGTARSVLKKSGYNHFAK
ncbi:thiamine-phosphate kinase [Halalkalibacterium halodurans]|uniref:Thiamine-monophosphate kinase n=1 Tax=Halalkalibacterium halodurans (strain ATCC BAA-125 / DSM 18197 / FERM 7344 / JCM 9153 / C-125) TaxID=272558 RepID=Q9KFD7_HALH5|nr:thiamine-phosphate kinase [Halalkalibacterium halodurans]MED4123571.1 thiamine-phosphate kinase [Halalkalibacterium halodurans]MED4173147.1 thiamine-phosphate kinase [Halalkalibacterium halodurans]BAB04263.1 thiamin-monophosphate kinase [Halalkalibacterium halodurans C-125]